MSEPENNESKGVNIGGESGVNVDRDAIGGDKIVHGFETNAGRDVNRVTVGAGANIGQLNVGGPGDAPFKPEELAAAKRAYLEFEVRSNANIIRPWIVQLPEDRPLRLDDLYVSLMVERASLDPALGRKLNPQQSPEPISVAQAIREHPRMLIKGDPGAGKSTLTRFLALLFSSAMWQSTKENDVAARQVQDKEGQEYGQPRLPILVRIADYDAVKGDSSLSLGDYLPMSYPYVDASQKALSQVFRTALRQGNALVLFDGLDEVANRARRSEIAKSIRKFVDAYPGNQFVATSRIAGYVPIAGFVPFTFSTLSGEQLGHIFARWYIAVRLAQLETGTNSNERIEDLLAHTELNPLVPEHLQSSFMPEAQQFVEEFERQVNANSGAQRLAENPLTLTMLVELCLSGEPIAKRRSDLYEKILADLLQKWETDERGSAQENIVPVWEAEEKLAPLAYWMQTSKTRDDRTGSGIEKELAKLCAGEYQKAADLWRRLREFTPLFVESSRGHFRFAHRTFQEYFVAKELLRDENKTADLIYQHRHEPNWDEPILLALSSVPDATELIRTAILAESRKAKTKNFGSSLYDDVLHRDFFFAARCITDGARVDEVLQKEIAEQLLEWWYEFGTWPGPMEPRRWQTWDSMKNAVRFTLMNLRGTELAEYIVARFREELANYELNPFQPTDSKLTRGERFAGMQNLYHTLEMWSPYYGLAMLGQECTAQVITFFMRLMRSHHTYAFRIGDDEIKELMKKEDVMKPVLQEMLKGDQESKLYAAILLGEYKVTTPKAIESLFEFYLEDAEYDEEQEEDSTANHDWESRHYRTEMRRRKQQLQLRALNALLVVEQPLEGYSLSDIADMLWSVIKSSNERIETLFKSHAEEYMAQHKDYRLRKMMLPYDLNRLTAAFLLVKLDKSPEALNILKQAVLNPIDEQLALYAARRFAELHECPDEIMTRALELSASDDWKAQSFAIDLFKDLHCKNGDVYSRLIGFIGLSKDTNPDSETDRDYIRKSAIKALDELGDIPSEHLPRILEIIKTDELLRHSCVHLLADGKIGMPEPSHREIAETLLALFPTRYESTAEAIEQVLGHFVISPDVLPLIFKALESKNERVYAAAWFALHDNLGHGHRVPDESFPGLGLFAYKLDISDETVKVLLAALTDSNSEVSERAAVVLSYSLHKSPVLMDGLRSLLQDKNPWARYRAMDLLLGFEYKEMDVVEAWLGLIKCEDEELRAEVAENISRLPLTEKVTDVAWSLARSAKSVRVKAECYEHIVKLNLGSDKAISLLAPMLEDDIALAEEAINDVEASPPETQERIALKLAAQSVLREYDELPPKIQAVLVRQTLSPDPKVRKDAVGSLRFKARLDSILAGRLLALLDDNDDEVCQLACEMIGELFGKFPVDFMRERKAIAEKLYVLCKEKRVHLISMPPPAPGPNRLPPPPPRRVSVPSSEQEESIDVAESETSPEENDIPHPGENDEQVGFPMHADWGALWVVSNTLSQS